MKRNGDALAEGGGIPELRAGSADPLPVLFFMLIFLSSCGTLPNHRRWGEDATLFPGWKRLGDSAVNALADPLTWAPLGGALLFQIDDWDRRVSDWAYKNI